MDDRFVKIWVFFTIWSTNGSLLGVHQWYPSWSAPMVPLLGCTNGTLLGVHQWYPCWGEPLAPLLGSTNGSLRGAPGPPRVGRKKVGRKKCPGKLHFVFWKKHSKCSETYLDRRISSRQSGSNFLLSKVDRRSLELWHFFSTLHFIWFLPIFQFVAYALPNRIWQALIFFLCGFCGRRGTPRA